MNKMKRSMTGVTLLEIMLVLAIAAMVIVMSVRYYQSASQSQQANTTIQMIQGITAAADGLAQGSGSYSNVDTAQITSLMPNNSMTTPWGTEITISATAATNYTVSIPGAPAAVCSQVMSRLGANSQYDTSATTCAATGNTDISYTYYSTPQ